MILHVISPFTYENVDLSLFQYADDLLKFLLAAQDNNFQSLAHRSFEENDLLDEALRVIVCRQNKAKQDLVPSLAGDG